VFALLLFLLAGSAFAADMPFVQPPELHCPGPPAGHEGVQLAIGAASEAASGLAVSGAPSAPQRTVVLPKLITGKLNSPSQVCDDARSSGKRFILVTFKTHICDREGKACLKTTQDISDTCNRFVRDNFALYHTRLYRLRPGGHETATEDPGIEDISAHFKGDGGPTFIVYDLGPNHDQCTEAARVGPGLDAVDPGAFGAKPQGPGERFAQMRQQLLAKVPQLGAALGTGANAAPDPGCLGQPAPTTDDVSAKLEEQWVSTYPNDK
jgi:hypothetical protein